MDATDVNARWQAAMAKYTPSGASPVDGAAELQHYFYLGSDRADAGGSPAMRIDPPGKAGSRSTLGLLAAAFGAGLCCGMIVMGRRGGR